MERKSKRSDTRVNREAQSSDKTPPTNGSTVLRSRGKSRNGTTMKKEANREDKGLWGRAW